MLFNSLQFLFFFPAICAMCWILVLALPHRCKVAGRNALLLVGSYYFYMCWQPAYALLLLASTAITYVAARAMDATENTRRRKLCLTASLVLNLAILFFFKYFNFAATSVASLLSACGMRMEIHGLDVLLPVGISFYIFQALGYSIDVYRGTVKAERGFLTYALFVSFFPQLVAGPIERSSNLLPQFKSLRKPGYEAVMDGLGLMLWGYFLKLALADRCGIYVDAVYGNLPMHNGGSFLLASVFFMFQIYGDFAGYSLIAIGTARVLGFELMRNFRQPYLSTTITDFWRRWHISLSSWFRDYVYISLGGNRTTKAKTCRNVLITFIVSGLWHGANWTFVLWGAGHGLLQVAERLLGWNRKRFAGLQAVAHWMLTMALVLALWVVFRSPTLSDTCTVFAGIFGNMGMPFENYSNWMAVMMALVVVMVKEASDESGLGCRVLSSPHWAVRHLAYIVIIVYLLTFGVLNNDQFIYFQF